MRKILDFAKSLTSELEKFHESKETAEGIEGRLVGPVECVVEAHLGELKALLKKDKNGKPAAAAVGVSYRTFHASNARVSRYSFADAPDWLSKFPRDRFEPAWNCAEMRDKFFTEILDLYFTVFGRGNTLNERVLDAQLKNEASDKECSIFRLIFSDTEGGQLAIDGKGTEMALLVPLEIWGKLIHLDGHEPGKLNLADRFWEISWLAFSESSNSCYEDWPRTAYREMCQAKAHNGDSSFINLLKLARLEVQEDLFVQKRLGEVFRLLYGHEGLTLHKGGQKVINYLSSAESLLRLVQGSLCLTPWAIKGKKPLDVVTIRVILDENGEKKMRSAWTILPYGSGNDGFSELAKAAQGRFEEALRGDEGRKLGDFDPPWNNDGKVDQNINRLTDVLKAELGRNGGDILRAAMSVTGDVHEADPVSYSFIFGDPVVLKYIQRVISNERPMSPCQEQRLGGGENESGSRVRRFSNRCRGHYAIFQEDRVVAFVDRYDELRVDRFIELRAPTDDEIYELHDTVIVDDQYRSVQWLTYKVGRVKACAIGIVAGGDGVLRVFRNGEMVISYKHRTSPEEPRWIPGVGLGKGDNSIEDSLRKEICKHFNEEEHNPLFKDLIATIGAISNSRGKGALFALDAYSEKANYMLEMVPDSFRMQWAARRPLSAIDQMLLKSLAVMDGAVYIERQKKNCPLLVSARNILVPRAGKHDGLDIDMDRWQESAEVCQDHEHRSQSKTLTEWRDTIGTKGTRHHSAFQFCRFNCLDKSRTLRYPLICSISADGPIHLYQARRCSGCREKYIWTEKIT